MHLNPLWLRPLSVLRWWVILLLLICCLVRFPLVVGVLCLSLFCCALLCVRFSFAISLKRKRDMVALLLLSYGCLVTVNVL